MHVARFVLSYYQLDSSWVAVVPWAPDGGKRIACDESPFGLLCLPLDDVKALEGKRRSTFVRSICALNDAQFREYAKTFKDQIFIDEMYILGQSQGAKAQFQRRDRLRRGTTYKANAITTRIPGSGQIPIMFPVRDCHRYIPCNQCKIRDVHGATAPGRPDAGCGEAIQISVAEGAWGFVGDLQHENPQASYRHGCGV